MPRRNAAQVADVAEALAKVLGDPVLARRMGEAGRRRAEEELSYDILASKLAATLRTFEAGARLLESLRSWSEGGVQVEEQVTERMVIRASPAYCFQVLTDFERYPEWASDIKAVVVDERDAEDGRHR